MVRGPCTLSPCTTVPPRWTADVSEGGIDTTGAFHDDSYLFGDLGGSLFALDVTDGSIRWERELASVVRSPPTVIDDRVYVASYGSLTDSDAEGYLHSIDPESGEEGWRFPLDDVGGHTSPAVTDGVVCAGSERGTVYGVDRESGEEMWAREIDVSTDVTVCEGVFYLGGDGGVVYALDAATGETLWSYEARDPVFTPVPIEDLLFVSSLDTRVYVLAGR